jgi:thiol-disulfide isomerase/thioredoxin
VQNRTSAFCYILNSVLGNEYAGYIEYRHQNKLLSWISLGFHIKSPQIQYDSPMLAPPTPPRQPHAKHQAQSGQIQRRHLVAIGASAALAGLGLAYWKDQQTPAPSTAEPQKPLSDDLTALWQKQFEAPDGSKLAMQSLKGKPLLINFWATWCPPCVEELPLLERFYRENKAKSVQIIGLAADKPDAVRAFLQKLPLTFSIGITDLSGIALSKSWGNLAGGLPFSVMLTADGRVMQRKMGKLSEDDLKTWLAAAQ